MKYLLLLFCICNVFTRSSLAETKAVNTATARSLWVWDAAVITQEANQAALFELCRQKNIGILYVSLGNFTLENKRPKDHPKHVSAQQLGAFLEKAHQRQIAVEGLGGDSAYALQKNHQKAISQMKRVLEYNKTATPERRFAGFQWDIEPYTLPEFKDAQLHDQVLQQFLDFIQLSVDEVKQSGQESTFTLGYALPFWMDSDRQAVIWNGVHRSTTFHALEILSGIPQSYVALMSYRDTTSGSNGSIQLSQDEMDYARENTPNVKVWVGQETGNVQPASITFYGKGESTLEGAIAEINRHFSNETVYGGVAIHHWSSYLLMTGMDVENPENASDAE